MEGLIFIGVIGLLWVSVLFANRMQSIADRKGATERVWAWCFWIPLLGALMVIALPDERVLKALGGKTSEENSDGELPSL